MFSDTKNIPQKTWYNDDQRACLSINIFNGFDLNPVRIVHSYLRSIFKAPHVDEGVKEPDSKWVPNPEGSPEGSPEI